MNRTIKTPTISPDRIVYVQNRIRAACSSAQGQATRGGTPKATHLRVVPDSADLWLGWALRPADGSQAGDIPIPARLANGDIANIVADLGRQGWLRIEWPQ